MSQWARSNPEAMDEIAGLPLGEQNAALRSAMDGPARPAPSTPGYVVTVTRPVCCDPLDDDCCLGCLHDNGEHRQEVDTLEEAKDAARTAIAHVYDRLLWGPLATDIRDWSGDAALRLPTITVKPVEAEGEGR